MKRFRLTWGDFWVAASTVGVAALALMGLYGYRLATLTPGISLSEKAQLERISSLQTLTNNPINAPYNLLQYLGQLIDSNGTLALRIASVLFAIVVVLCFYSLLRLWCSRLVAGLATFLFASSSWLLHYGRLGVPLIALTAFVCLVTGSVWLEHSKRRRLIIFASTICIATLLYIPGMIWFIVPGIIWQWRNIRKELIHVPVWFVMVCNVILLIAIVPLILSIVRDTTIIKPLLGMPEKLPGISTYISNLLDIVKQLFWRTPFNPVVGLARLPLLDVFTAIMFILGLYGVITKWRLDRSKLLLGSMVLGCLLVALGGTVKMVVLLPFVYLIAAMGIAFMLEQWFMVFPRNPLARNLGIGLMVVAVVLAVFYNVNQYFVAWSAAPATKAVFQRKP